MSGGNIGLCSSRSTLPMLWLERFYAWRFGIVGMVGHQNVGLYESRPSISTSNTRVEYVLCLSRDYLLQREKHSRLETCRWAITFEGCEQWGAFGVSGLSEILVVTEVSDRTERFCSCCRMGQSRKGDGRHEIW